MTNDPDQIREQIEETRASLTWVRQLSGVSGRWMG
ncbi:MAG: DUF3618 domain-containing protein [Streptosporangiaceae bacterium]